MLPKMGKKLHRRHRGDGADADFAGLIAAALRAELGSTHRAIKMVMGWTGASERTVKHWFAGTHCPSGEHLVALTCHSDEVLTAFLSMAGRGPIFVGAKLVELRLKLLETIDHIDALL